jgi:large subunit ribosomal protein L31
MDAIIDFICKIQPFWLQHKISPIQSLPICSKSILLQSFKIRHGQNHAKTIKKFKTMKKEIHPNYKEVIFWDTTSDFKFLSRSTNVPKETIKWTDGKDYPVIKVEVSSASHPFFTGKKMFLDTAGRVEKFQKKYGKKETA